MEGSVSQSVMSVMSVRRGSTFKEYQFPGTSAADEQDPPRVRDLEFIGHGGRGGAGRLEESRVWGGGGGGCGSGDARARVRVPQHRNPSDIP